MYNNMTRAVTTTIETYLQSFWSVTEDGFIAWPNISFQKESLGYKWIRPNFIPQDFIKGTITGNPAKGEKQYWIYEVQCFLQIGLHQIHIWTMVDKLRTIFNELKMSINSVDEIIFGHATPVVVGNSTNEWYQINVRIPFYVWNFSGYGAVSGWEHHIPWESLSGTSGYSGVQGYSGISGYSGYSGYRPDEQVYDEIATDPINGTNKEFFTAETYVFGTTEVYFKNGDYLLKVPTSAYTETGNSVVFTSAPQPGFVDSVHIYYRWVRTTGP